jgi:hypothetical protein
MLKPRTVACAVILATGMVNTGWLRWKATLRGPCWISLVSAPASSTWNLKRLRPSCLVLPFSDFISASMPNYSTYMHQRHDKGADLGLIHTTNKKKLCWNFLVVKVIKKGQWFQSSHAGLGLPSHQFFHVLLGPTLEKY